MELKQPQLHLQLAHGHTYAVTAFSVCTDKPCGLEREDVSGQVHGVDGEGGHQREDQAGSQA